MRKIIHCDADCFFAAVEAREDPSLRNRPIAVGGSHERRGVISTCNYEARTYGVHSAMSSAQAKRLCPDLIIIPPNMGLYQQVSQQIRSIYYDYTDKIEPLSLDEAFLDVSDSDVCKGSATLIAEQIRQRIFAELKITVSAGVSANKFIAKVASDWHKPNGLMVVPPDRIAAFIHSLPVKRIFGVGKVTAAKLQQLGIASCADLQRWSEIDLCQQFGSLGSRLYQLCRGIDDREVVSEWRRKSLSVEHTYAEDLPSVDHCLSQLPSLYSSLLQRMEHLDRGYRIAKAFVKVKFADFQTTTMERLGTSMRISDFRNLCIDAVKRQSTPVRLLGLGVRLLDQQQGEHRQLQLFPESELPLR